MTKLSILPLLAALAASSPASAQNGPDVEVFGQFAHNYSGSVGCKPFDIAYSADGHLIAAFGEDRPAGSDRLIVAEYDPATNVWLVLCDQSLGLDEIFGLELAVPPVKFGDSLRDQWYVAAALYQGPVSAGSAPANYVALYTGKLGKKWGPIARFFQNLPATVNTSVEVHPTLALTPIKPGDWSNYAVDVFACWGENPNGTHGTIWRATSIDYGRWFAHDQRVAGPHGTMLGLDGALIDHGEFGHPSAYGDEHNAVTLLAFEDPSTGTVRVGSSSIGGTFTEIFATKADGRTEFAPTIVAYDNDVNFTCRTEFGAPSGSSGLTWYVGTPFGLFDELQPLHGLVETAADLGAYESDAFVAVIAYPDQSGAPAAFALEGDRDDDTVTLPSVMVSDSGKAWGPARVAVTPDGVQPFRRTYGWTNYLPNGQKVGVWLDF
ncbi:MAG: hypothetical protein HZA52_08630 [Planctomycetes bacterium]|nr:hypothetical protein [Planctomycetota bacterium]